MNFRRLFTAMLSILCISAFTTIAFATDTADHDAIIQTPPNNTPETIDTPTVTDYPLNETVFLSQEFLFARRKGTPIATQNSTSSRITDDPNNQLVTQEMIWSTDQIDLLDGEAYYAKVQFEYDHDNYGDKELWLHISLPHTTDPASTTHLSATLTLVDPIAKEVLAQINQQIPLYTPNDGQTIKFYPRIVYTSLPDVTGTVFQTAEVLTSDDNVSILLPATTSKGIILFDFRSDNTPPPLLSSPPAAWGAGLSIFSDALSIDKGDHINAAFTPDDASSTEPTANELDTQAETETTDPSPIPPSTKIFGLRLPFTMDFNFKLSKILTLKIIFYLVICALIILTALELRSRSIQRQRRIARAKRHKEYDTNQQTEIKLFQAELDRLFSDDFLNFDVSVY